MKTETKSAAHSPGPWSYKAAHTCDTKISFDISAPHGPTFDRFDVAHLTNPYSGTAEGNARLIAAAPELLQACVRLMRLAENTGLNLDIHPSYQEGRAAIAKAEGRS